MRLIDQKDWCVAAHTITFSDNLHDNQGNQAWIKYDITHSVYYIHCKDKNHRLFVTESVIDRLEEYLYVKKIEISDDETEFVLKIPVAQSVTYKKKFG
jgi:hypothetical protein